MAPMEMREDAAGAPKALEAPAELCHGLCFGFSAERDAWAAPRLAAHCAADARPGYDSMDASEYLDTPEVLRAKARALARLVRRARRCVVYSGAGLSTSAGIGDYASQARDTMTGVPGLGGGAAALRSPLCAQPTLAHRVLVAMQRAGKIHRWINQNHDGLPQKAGLPQQCINEIHGAWHAPDNPVVPMDGELRGDLYQDLLDCVQEADLVLALGTSLCGMNADRLVTAAAERAASAGDGPDGPGGAVIVSLQRTVHDAEATLRFFAPCDDVFALLAEELELDVAPAWPQGEYFVPDALSGRGEGDYLFQGLPYDGSGRHSDAQPRPSLSLDLRENAEVVITGGMHAGARGTVDGYDREGNVRCRFTLQAPKGRLRAPVAMLLGRWWLQAAVEGAAPMLPVVNPPAEGSGAEGAQEIRRLMERYAKPSHTA